MASFSADEVRLIEVGAPIFLKMLKDREKRIFDRIYGNFRNNQKDFLTDIAEFATIREQINEINNVIKPK